MSKMTGKRAWRSLSELANTDEFRERQFREFPENATEIEADGVSRRQFLGLVSASAALAGVGMQGCVRKPPQHILPYTERPEDLIPGRPRYYATALWAGSSVLGVLAESHEGRPTKIEGNPRHPMSLGGTNTYAQAEVLALYDNDRSHQPLHNSAEVSWAAAIEALDATLAAHQGNNGAGLSVLVDGTPSPTLNRQVDALRAAYPEASVYRWDPAVSWMANAGLDLVGLPASSISYDLGAAQTVVALDADLFGLEPGCVANAARFMQNRLAPGESSHGAHDAGHGAHGGAHGDSHQMSRLYAVEPAFTITGATADHRFRLASSQVGDLLLALGAALITAGLTPAAGGGAVVEAINAHTAQDYGDFVGAVAADLVDAGAGAVIAVGERQPAWVHGLAAYLNASLGSVGSAIRIRRDETTVQTRSLGELVDAIDAGDVQTLFVLGGNPVYSAPADFGLAERFDGVSTTIRLGYHADETSAVCDWHLPQTHQLETWGDLRATDGTVSIQQPLIDPLFTSMSAIELLNYLTTGHTTSPRALVQATWQTDPLTWNRWLHDGIAVFGADPAGQSYQWGALARAVSEAVIAPVPTSSSLEIVFAKDYSTYDGRYANVSWLQELPDPITKMTWDNAALVGPETADALGLAFTGSGWSGEWERRTGADFGRDEADIVTLSVGGQTLANVPVFVSPGLAEGVVVLPFGYGRAVGSIANCGDENRAQHKWGGVNAAKLWSTGDDSVRAGERVLSFIHQGVSLSKSGEQYFIATTQDHWSMEGRPQIREASLSEYNERPDFVIDGEIVHAEHIESLWEEPNARTGQQWGMVIDLNKCIGCNVCTIACQAENNISVVGKKEVLNGREMHWIRIDRYFVGDDATNPEARMQPVTCMHCENAPCEQVCPVAATVHGPEGTNDMAYNRCVGTRYCANNCPYKVRRFNFFNFSKTNDQQNPLYLLQKNPDVTVRFRGVMEKCTYCIQRVNAAKIDTKVNSDGVIADGAIVTACQQACPTNAIVFGDINDPTSRVSRLRLDSRNYGVLQWLNTKPRTTYLARVRNVNPALSTDEQEGH